MRNAKSELTANLGRGYYKSMKNLLYIFLCVFVLSFLFPSPVNAWSETDIPVHILNVTVLGGATGNGELSTPYGIALDSAGNYYLTEEGNDRVQKFDSTGHYLMKFGSVGTADGQFSNPQGIFVDSSNNIYVADYSNHRIQKFDSSGNFLSKFGSIGSGDGQFMRPRDIAVDSSGNIYVADAGNNRIQKFDSSGNFF